MDFSPEWMQVAQAALYFAGAAAIWVLNRKFIPRDEYVERCQKCDQRHDVVDRRVIRLEGGMVHVPSKEDVSRMEGDIREVRAYLSANKEALARIEGQLGSINEFLLQQGRG